MRYRVRDPKKHAGVLFPQDLNLLEKRKIKNKKAHLWVFCTCSLSMPGTLSLLLHLPLPG